MRNLIVSSLVSLDGIHGDPQSWVGDDFDQQAAEESLAVLLDSDAMPTKRPWVDAAAYSSPLTESEDAAAWDVDAAIAAAGLMTRAAAATTGTVHPRHRMTYPPFEPAGEPNSEGSSVCKPAV